MFTVKHQDGLGNVWVKECHDVSIESSDSMAWVRLRDENGKEIAFRNGWPESDQPMDTIYIMNASGATIHTLRLRVSAACSFGSVGECADASAINLAA